MPARIEDVWWDDDVLRLKGYAYIAFQELPTERSGRIRLTLEESGHPDSVIPLEVRRVRRPDVTEAGAGRCDQLRRVRLGGRGPGERAAAPREVPDRQLAAAARGPGEGRHPAPVALRHRPGPGEAAGLADRRRRADRPHHRRPATSASRSRPPPPRSRTSASTAPCSSSPAPCTVAGSTRPPRRCALRATTAPPRWSCRSPPAGRRPAAAPRSSRGSTSAPSAPTRTSTRPSRTVATSADGDVWSLSLLPEADGARISLSAGSEMPQPRLTRGDTEVLVHITRTGRPQVIGRHPRPEVEGVSWSDDGTLELTGRYAEASGAETELVLSAAERAVSLVVPMTRDGDSFTARLKPTSMATPGGPMALAEGQWDFYSRRDRRRRHRAGQGGPRDPVRLLPQKTVDGARELMAYDVDHDCLALLVSGDLPVGDRGRAGQRRLRTQHYPSYLPQPVREQVLFDGYGAGRHGDDARALHDELLSRDTGLDVVWAVHDGQAVPPDGARAVARNGRDWYEALARSRFRVTSDLQGCPRPAVGSVGRRCCRPGTASRSPPSGWTTSTRAPGSAAAGRSGCAPSRRAGTCVLSAGPHGREVLQRAFALGGLGARDRSPPARPAGVPRPRRGAGEARGCGPRRARHPGRPSRRAARAHLPARPAGRTGPLPARPVPRPGTARRVARRRPRAAGPGPPQGRRHRPAGRRPHGVRRVMARRRSRPAARRRRAGDRLLVGARRLRADRAPDGVLHPGPRALPGPSRPALPRARRDARRRRHRRRGPRTRRAGRRPSRRPVRRGVPRPRADPRTGQPTAGLRPARSTSCSGTAASQPVGYLRTSREAWFAVRTRRARHTGGTLRSRLRGTTPLGGADQRRPRHRPGRRPRSRAPFLDPPLAPAAPPAGRSACSDDCAIASISA